jgi:hypothetical protein
MSATWRVYMVSALIACGVAAATTLLTLRLAAARLANEAVVQEGLVELNFDGGPEVSREREVYYKAPFAEPPNLTFPGGLQGVEVADQKAGSFKLRRFDKGGLINGSVQWRAEGRPAP